MYFNNKNNYQKSNTFFNDDENKTESKISAMSFGFIFFVQFTENIFYMEIGIQFPKINIQMNKKWFNNVAYHKQTQSMPIN